MEISISNAEIIKASIEMQLYHGIHEKSEMKDFMYSLSSKKFHDMIKKNLFRVPQVELNTLQNSLRRCRESLFKIAKSDQAQYGVALATPMDIPYRSTFRFSSILTKGKGSTCNDAKELGYVLGHMKFVTRWMLTMIIICHGMSPNELISQMNTIVYHTSRLMVMAITTFSRLKIWPLFQIGVWEDMDVFRSDGQINIDEEEVKNLTFTNTPHWMRSSVYDIVRSFREICSRWSVINQIICIVEFGVMANIKGSEWNKAKGQKELSNFINQQKQAATWGKTSCIPKIRFRVEGINDIILGLSEKDITRTSSVLYSNMIKLLFYNKTLEQVSSEDQPVMIKCILQIINVSIPEESKPRVYNALLEPHKYNIICSNN